MSTEAESWREAVAKYFVESDVLKPMSLEHVVDKLAQLYPLPDPPEVGEMEEGHRYMPVPVENLQVGDIIWFLKGEYLRVSSTQTILGYHIFTVGSGTWSFTTYGKPGQTMLVDCLLTFGNNGGEIFG